MIFDVTIWNHKQTNPDQIEGIDGIDKDIKKMINEHREKA